MTFAGTVVCDRSPDLVTQPNAVGIRFDSNEPICNIVNGELTELLESSWISSKALDKDLEVRKFVIADVCEAQEVVQSDEV